MKRDEMFDRFREIWTFAQTNEIEVAGVIDNDVPIVLVLGNPHDVTLPADVALNNKLTFHTHPRRDESIQQGLEDFENFGPDFHSGGDLASIFFAGKPFYSEVVVSEFGSRMVMVNRSIINVYNTCEDKALFLKLVTAYGQLLKLLAMKEGEGANALYASYLETFDLQRLSDTIVHDLEAYPGIDQYYHGPKALESATDLFPLQENTYKVLEQARIPLKVTDAFTTSFVRNKKFTLG